MPCRLSRADPRRDLYSEVSPIYTRTASYYGTPFVWNMLHNFGGNVGLYGTAGAVVTSHVAARAMRDSTLLGVGVTMEGTEQNYVVYELALEHTCEAHATTTR